MPKEIRPTKTPERVRQETEKIIARQEAERRERHELAEMQAESVASPEHPKKNEDSYFIDEQLGIAGIFDGMGGAEHGDIASRLASEGFLENIQKAPKTNSALIYENFIFDALRDISKKILKESEKNETLKGMGTTATVIKILEDSNGEKRAVIGNVGDSRAYLLRNGKLTRLTKDHSIVQMSIDSGEIKNDEDVEQLITWESELQKIRDIRHVVLHALGVSKEYFKKLQPDVQTVRLLEGDMIILSSDGIHDNLTDKEIEQIVNGVEVNATDGSKYPFSKQLVDKASKIESNINNPRSKEDDKTAIVIRI